MVSLSEVESELNSLLGSSWEWAVGFVTNQKDVYGGSTDDYCQNDYYSPHTHQWRGVTVDLTWYSDLLTKVAAGYLIFRIGLKRVATRAWYQNVSATALGTMIGYMVKNDTYTFVGYEDDTNTWSDYYWPHYWAGVSHNWHDTPGGTAAIVTMTGHPSSDKYAYA